MTNDKKQLKFDAVTTFKGSLAYVTERLDRMARNATELRREIKPNGQRGYVGKGWYVFPDKDTQP